MALGLFGPKDLGAGVVDVKDLVIGVIGIKHRTAGVGVLTTTDFAFVVVGLRDLASV